MIVKPMREAGGSRSAVVCAVPADGHVRPLLAVSRGLMSAGWRVRFLTGPGYRDVVVAAGAEWASLGDDSESTSETDHNAPRLSGIGDLNQAIRTFVVEPAARQAEALLGALADADADLVVADNLFLGALAVGALPAHRRPMYVCCSVMPLALPSVDTAPFGLGLTPVSGPLGRFRNHLIERLTTRVILRPAHADLEWLLKEWGLPGLDGGLFTEVLRRPDLVAQCTVPSFEYPRTDAPDNLIFIGPASRAVPSADPPPLPFEHDRPTVHVTQGTVANVNWTELVGPTLEALADEPLNVLVTTGGRPLSTLPPLPANAVAAEFLDYGDVLPRCSAFVTNGGYGGLHAAMEHGLPIVIAGDTEEKRETAARVRWSGVGIDLKRARPRPDRVRAAVLRVLGDPRYAMRSRRIGADIIASSSLAGLLTHIERLAGGR